MTETFDSFTRRVQNFDALSHSDKICHAAWYLHTSKGMALFRSTDINNLFEEIHSVPPQTSVYLKRMSEKKPPLLIKNKSGYRLENKPRRLLEDKFGKKDETAAISSLLSGLLEKVKSDYETTFLEEALRCYSVRAFRASIVMAWNLSFNHLINWIVVDPARLTAFNTSLSAKYPKSGLTITKLDDFPDLKEFEVIEVMRHAKLINKNLSDLLKEKLKRRNFAAHPSNVVITQAQADDVLTDLINNVVDAISL